MSRDLPPRELDEAPASLAELRSIDREPQERDLRTLSPRAQEPRPERFSRDRLPEIQFRALLSCQDSRYLLSASEVRTMVDLGTFRVISRHALAQHRYGGSLERADRDLENLLRQRLVRRGAFEGPEASPRELLTLTQSGHELLRSNGLVPENQAVYYGFTRRPDAHHDADLYRLYQKEAARIREQGGRNLRVILDHELRRDIQRDIARLPSEARQEIAAWHGLRVVGNKIPVPDLRIEYETRDGELGHVDLELVTEHYGARDALAKARAGFSLYTPHGEGGRLRRLLGARGMTPEILSL